MANFVMVHGAWHGGWSYDRVASRLRNAGHQVLAPTLTGLAERADELSPDVGLRTHIDDIVAVIRKHDLKRIVLVGHSYGGMVVEGVADALPDAIGGLIFIDALVATTGQCAVDVVSGLGAALDAMRDPKRPWLVFPIPAASLGLSGDNAALVDSFCTAHPLKSFTEPLTLTGASEKIRERQFILAEGWGNLSFESAADKLRKTGGWVVHTIRGSHDLMIDRPDELAAILIEFAVLQGPD